MSERSRNIVVGLTAIIGLVLLATMILIFTGLPELFSTGYVIQMHFDDSHSLQSGDSVWLLGQQVGTLTDVRYTNNNPLEGVTMTARIDDDIRLPTNVKVRVYSKGLVGKGYLALVPEGDFKKDPATGETIKFYQPGDKIVLQGKADTGSSLLPPELTSKLESIGDLAESLKELIDPEPATTQPATPPGDGQAATQPAEPPIGLKGTVARMNRTLDAIYAITGDPDNQQNIKRSLENLSEVSGNADELVRKLITDAEDISKLVRGLQQTVGKLNEGEGTMSQLLNDPQLYRSLLNLTEQLDKMAKQAERLLQRWEQDGLDVKL